jgi:hypothetical protein
VRHIALSGGAGRYNCARMKPWFAVLALCTCLPLCAQQPPSAQPSTAQAQVAQPSTAQPSTAQPQAAQPPTAQRPTTGQSAAPRAQPVPVYRVEVVVFRALSALGAPEDWSAEHGGAADPSATATDPRGDSAAAGTGFDTGGGATAPPPPRAVVRMLTASDFQLDGVAERLQASGRFQPIAHAAWWQTASPWGRPIEIPVQSIGLDAQGLTGTLSLQKGEFLHLELSLDYGMDNPPEGLGAAPGTVFSLHAMHRVKINERNYFDHPAFGVIALVTGVQESKRAKK